MKNTVGCFAAIVALALLGNSAQAAVVTVFENFQDGRNVAGGGVNRVNSGGLAGGTTELLGNGSNVLKLLVEIDDTSDTGARFNATLRLSGKLNASPIANNPRRVAVDSNGNLVFGNGPAQMDQLTFTLSDVVQVSGPSATAVFDGIATVDLASWTLGTESFNFDGSSYNAISNPAGTLTFGSLAPSGSTIDQAGTLAGGFLISGVSTQWTVSAATAVPEPSSLAISGLIAMGIGLRKRRKKTSAAA